MTNTATLYDPPSGWRYGFPKLYNPLPGEDLEATLLRDGYPQSEIDAGNARHCRFIGVDPERVQPTASNDNESERERPMTGFLATLSPAQQEAAVNYRGEDYHPSDDELQRAADARGEPYTPRIGSWMQTYSGKAVYPMDLRPEDICIEDIAHALSMQCRYNGHSLRFYSVAEHSVLIARHLRQKHNDAVALEGLLHDATEAYLADVPRPVKPFLQGYKEAEARAWAGIAYRYDLQPNLHPAVHDADNRILHDERIQNMARSEKEWGLTGVRLGVTLQFWSPGRAKAEFLALFAELYGEE